MHVSTHCALALALALAPLGDDKDRPAPEEPQAETAWEYLVEKYDADGDGVITRKEYAGPDERWKLLDLDKSGKLDKAEIESRGRVKGANPSKKKPKAPKLGRKAPLFELEVLEDVHDLPEEAPKGDTPKEDQGKEDGHKAKEEPRTIALADFKGEEPVALIFGSYT